MILACSMMAQEFVQVSYLSSYSGQSFYTLADDGQQEFLNTEWDIAFSAFGGQDAGIHINEATRSMGAELAVFVSPSNDFNDVIDTADLMIRLFNEDITWDYGAFNSLRNQDNPLDYGWGQYDPMTHQIKGNEVFIMILRNGQPKKFEIIDLDAGVYNVRWADLDGSNEETMAINKGNYPNDDLILLSVENSEIVGGVKPFDMFFTRYVTPLDDGNGGTLDYTLTGVLHGANVATAQADGIDPNTVVFDDYKDSLNTQIDVIGYDWKEFDLFNGGWQVFDNVAYFVKDLNNVVWKVVFIDFEGSSTGNTVFTKEEVGMVTSTSDVEGLNGWLVSPNPANQYVDLVIEMEKGQQVSIDIHDLSGRNISASSVVLPAGFITQRVDLDHLRSGIYTISLSNETGKTTKRLVIR